MTFYNYKLFSDMATQDVIKANQGSLMNQHGIPNIYNYEVNNETGYTYKPPDQNPVNYIANQDSAINKQSEFNRYVSNMMYGTHLGGGNSPEMINEVTGSRLANTYPNSRTNLIGESPEQFTSRNPNFNKENYQLSPYWGTPFNDRTNPIVDKWPEYPTAVERNALNYIEQENYRPTAKYIKNNTSSPSNIYINKPSYREHFETPASLNTSADVNSIDDANYINSLTEQQLPKNVYNPAASYSQNVPICMQPIRYNFNSIWDQKGCIFIVIAIIVVLFIIGISLQVFFNQKKLDYIISKQHFSGGIAYNNNIPNNNNIHEDIHDELTENLENYFENKEC